jgi:hypothetical protein
MVPVSDTNADDLATAAERFRQDAEKWIRAKYPRLA